MTLGLTHNPGVWKLSGVRELSSGFRFLLDKLKQENLVLSKIGSLSICSLIMSKGLLYRAVLVGRGRQYQLFFLFWQAHSFRFFCLPDYVVMQSAEEGKTFLHVGEIREFFRDCDSAMT